MYANATNSGQSTHSAPRLIEIELLALDLKACTRCVGTLKNIETAVATVRKVMEVTGTDVRIRKILIESEDQARQNRFLSSPTIRINGQDLVFETLESRCDSCTDLCGCAEGTACRVWRYLGQEYREAPVGLIVEGLLKQLSGAETPPASPYPGVSENLKRFYSSRAQRSAAPDGCCSTKEQEDCCEADDKVSCCSQAEPTTCGCR